MVNPESFNELTDKTVGYNSFVRKTAVENPEIAREMAYVEKPIRDVLNQAELDVQYKLRELASVGADTTQDFYEFSETEEMLRRTGYDITGKSEGVTAQAKEIETSFSEKAKDALGISREFKSSHKVLRDGAVIGEYYGVRADQKHGYRPLSEIFSDAEGNPKYYIEYKYRKGSKGAEEFEKTVIDAEGKIVQTVTRRRSFYNSTPDPETGELIASYETTTSIYNEQGDQVCVKELDERDGYRSETSTYFIRDEEGRIINEARVSGTSVSYKAHGYNSDGAITTETEAYYHVDKEGKTKSSRKDYEFGEAGYPKASFLPYERDRLFEKMTETNQKGEKTVTERKFEDIAGKKLPTEEVITHQGKEVEKKTFEYDGKGNCIREILVRDGKTVTIWERAYDNNGDVEKTRLINPDTGIVKYEVTYRRDKRGNCIEEECIDYDENGKKQRTRRIKPGNSTNDYQDEVIEELDHTVL